MTDESIETFKSLDWKAHTIRQLLSRDDDDAIDFWNVFFEAYVSSPLKEIESFRSRLLGYEYIFRGAVWELFLWKQLAHSVESIEIEHQIGDSLKTADFAWEYHDKPILLEATTIKRSNLEIRASSSESQLLDALENKFQGFEYAIQVTTVMGSEAELKIDEILLSLENFYKSINPEDLESSGTQFLTWKDSESDWNLKIALIGPSEFEKGTTPSFIMLSPFKERRDEDPRGMAEKLRRSLWDKLDKFETIKDESCVVAIAHELDALGESRIDQYATLIGRWSLRLNPNTLESSSELTDHGFFLSEQDRTRKISAILFGYGFVPGFSSVVKPILWLNPFAINELDLTGFPLDVAVVKIEGDGTLLVKESNRDSLEWKILILF
jgi:hypothetical protein